MKKLLILLMILPAFYTNAQQAMTNIPGRNTLSLNGK